MRAACALVALLLAPPAPAHEALSAAATERYLQQEARWRAATREASAPARRAEAHYRLGVLREEIGERLNAELEAHGEVRGLGARLLLEELRSRDAPLARDETTGRYLPEDEHYARARALAPRAPFAADAGVRLLRARFYRSFDTDPLAWQADERALGEQIALAQDLLTAHPDHPAREEIEFIAAILYTRAARLPQGAARYAQKARAATEAFEARYPTSLRAAAMPVLREALPP